MRVAILTRDYPPAIGGIATHVNGLVRALRARGVDVDLFVGSNDVKTLLLPFDIPLKKYDLVHVQSAPYGAFVVGVPLVVTVHSPVLEEFGHYRALVKGLSLPAMALERTSLRRASAILAVSGQTKTDLQRVYGIHPSKVGVIGNGVDYERYSRLPRAEAGGGRILVVSRLEARKNVREAIEAVASLPLGSCQLDVAGDGSERRALEELVRKLKAGDRIHLLGRVEGDALPELYARAEIFLTTSDSEGFGLSLLEAMSSGCACVASDLPTHRALVEPGKSGLIYENRAELIASLQTLLASPEMVTRLGTEARIVANAHSWDNVGERAAEAYASIL